LTITAVIATARRTGSLDSKIREPTQNDLLTLIGSLPALNTIAFNGGTAAKIGIKALETRANDYRILLLPSSSPAHASLSYAQKLVVWLQLAASDT
jgi:hypoxanthine-DNA glycosylase